MIEIQIQMLDPNKRDARNLPFPLSPHERPHTHISGSTEFIGEIESQVSTSDIETHHLGDHEPGRRAGRSGGGLAVAAATDRIYVDVHHVAVAVGGGHHVSLLRRWWLVFHLHGAGCWFALLRVAVVWQRKKRLTVCICLLQFRDSYSGCGFGMWHNKASATHKLNLLPLLFGFDM